MSLYKSDYEIKLRKGRIDKEREENGLEPIYARHEKEYPDEKSKAVTPREFFAHLESLLSEEARKCDVGLHVRAAGGPFVNDYREGRELTIRERLDWLIGKMHERRCGRWESVTLTKLFPKDAEIIQSALIVHKKQKPHGRKKT